MIPNQNNQLVDQLELLKKEMGTLEDTNKISRSSGLINAAVGITNIKLTTYTQELTEEQIRVSNRANELTEKLLESNKKASEQSENSAKLMNNATQELAKSTRSLNRATWVLVAFTAVQALIAFAALYKK